MLIESDNFHRRFVFRSRKNENRSEQIAAWTRISHIELHTDGHTRTHTSTYETETYILRGVCESERNVVFIANLREIYDIDL